MEDAVTNSRSQKDSPEYRAFSSYRVTLVDSLADHPDCIAPLAQRLKEITLDHYAFQSICNDPLGVYDKASKIVNSASVEIRQKPSTFNLFVAELKEVGLSHDAEALEHRLSAAVANEKSPKAFNETVKRARLETGMVKDVFNPQEAFKLMKDSGVDMSRWTEYTAQFNVPLEKKRSLRQLSDEDAFEECLDFWHKNSEGEKSMQAVIGIVEKYEKTSAKKMRWTLRRAYQLQDQVDTLQQQLDSLKSKLLHAEKEDEDEVGNLKQQIEQLLVENQQLKQDHEVYNIPTATNDPNTIYLPPVKFEMTEFNQCRNKKENWYSPPFYTHQNGYKMCLRIKPSGQDDGEGKYLSLYVHVMRGEHDDLLPWPFKGGIKVHLINRESNTGHYERSFTFDDKETDPHSTKRVTAGAPIPTGVVSDVGHGASKFILQSALEYSSTDDTEFLKNDSIIVQVSELSVYTSNFAIKQPHWIVPGKEKKPIAELTLSEFKKHRKVGDEWRSKSFLSHEKGYTLFLIVYANGKANKQGKSVSVYVHLKRGEHDNKLTFPFTGKVCVQLLNAVEDKNHVEKIVPFTDEVDKEGTTRQRVTDRSYNEEGLGFKNFLAHEDLEFNQNRNTQYLDDDDCLQFRIPWVDI